MFSVTTGTAALDCPAGHIIHRGPTAEFWGIAPDLMAPMTAVDRRHCGRAASGR